MNNKNISIKRAKTSLKQEKKVPRRIKTILLGVALLVLLFIGMLLPMMMDHTDRTVSIKIPQNATNKIVSDSLTKYFGADFSAKVMRLAKLRGANFSKRHGIYEIVKGSTPFSTMRKIVSGGQTPIRITINGFRDQQDMIRRISSKFEFQPAELQALVADPQIMAKYGLTPQNAMALFLDDTYEFYWTSKPEDIISKIGDNYLKFWNEERKQKVAELGLSPAEAIVIASIADEETNSKSERGIVSRLYLNRLNKNMRLQADPTVRFALGDFTIKRIKSEHLKTDSPYNTYRVSGLPPGPIRTTNAESIDALLNSKPHNYLYMCAKEDFSGTHNFSSTFEKHTKNATLYRHTLDSNGIK